MLHTLRLFSALTHWNFHQLVVELFASVDRLQTNVVLDQVELVGADAEVGAAQGGGDASLNDEEGCATAKETTRTGTDSVQGPAARQNRVLSQFSFPVTFSSFRGGGEEGRSW